MCVCVRICENSYSVIMTPQFFSNLFLPITPTILFTPFFQVVNQPKVFIESKSYYWEIQMVKWQQPSKLPQKEKAKQKQPLLPMRFPPPSPLPSPPSPYPPPPPSPLPSPPAPLPLPLPSLPTPSPLPPPPL